MSEVNSRDHDVGALSPLVRVLSLVVLPDRFAQKPIGSACVPCKHAERGYFETEPRPLPPVRSILAVVVGFVAICYGWWNIRRGPCDWWGVVALICGIAIHGYGAGLVLDWSVR